MRSSYTQEKILKYKSNTRNRLSASLTETRIYAKKKNPSPSSYKEKTEKYLVPVFHPYKYSTCTVKEPSIIKNAFIPHRDICRSAVHHAAYEDLRHCRIVYVYRSPNMNETQRKGTLEKKKPRTLPVTSPFVQQCICPFVFLHTYVCRSTSISAEVYNVIEKKVTSKGECLKTNHWRLSSPTNN